MPADGLADGVHTFAVTAVYEGGKESAPATAVFDYTGITEIALDGQPVDVYTIDGRLVRRQATSFEGLKGIYLIGNKWSTSSKNLPEILYSWGSGCLSASPRLY